MTSLLLKAESKYVTNYLTKYLGYTLFKSLVHFWKKLNLLQRWYL